MRPTLALLFAAVTAHASVTGTVVTDDGAPLAGARVRAFAREPFSATAARLLSNAPDPVAIATAESAADGRFTLDAKGNATIDMVVDAAGREPAALFVADGDDAGAIALHAADKASPRRAKLTLDGKPLANAIVYLGHALVARSDAQGMVTYTQTGEPAYVVHPDLGAGFASDRNGEVQVHRGTPLRGRVVARDGTTPVAGATIVAGGWPLATSAADGTFAIAHAPYRVRAVVAISGSDAGSAAADPAKPLVIRLGTAASLAGTVTTKDRGPVAGATVAVMSEDASASATAVTDSKGHYAFAALPAGAYGAQVFHPSFLNARTSNLHVATATTYAFTMTPRSRVRGLVVGEDRKPVAGAFVGGGLTSSGVNRIVMTAPNGEFNVQYAINGPLFIEAWKAGYAVAISPPLTIEPGTTKSGVTLTLHPGFPLQVKVVDRDKQPVANATVDLNVNAEGADGNRVVPVPCSLINRVQCRVTGADGTMQTRIAEGKYNLYVAGGEFVPKTIPGQELTAKSSPFVVTVERGAEVSGRVVYGDGTPVADARVSTMGEMQGSSAVTDANGAFTMKQLPRTPMTFVATLVDEATMRSAPVKTTPPARDVVLTIPTPARIEGRVIDRATLQPVTAFNVSAARRDIGMNRGVDVTSPDGAFVLKRVQPGTIEVRVNAPGYVTGLVSDLTVEEGKALTGVEVKLDRAGRVVGHITAGGSAAAGARVRAGARLRRGAFAQADSNGDFTLDGVPPGEETIDFMKEGFLTKHKDVEIVAGKDTRVDVDLDRGKEIRGRVIDKSGQPVANARVNATQPGAGGPSSNSATSADDGQFTLSGLEEGRYSVNAQKNGYVGATADDVDASAGRPVTLTLDRGATITGRVTGLPAEELGLVRVTASGRNANASERTDAGGNFTLTGIPDGTITLTAFRQGAPTRTSPPKQVEVTGGTAPPVEIDFGAGITIRGRVTRNGVAVTGGGVSFAPKGRVIGRVPSTMIGADGLYEISGVEPGDYDVRVNVIGGANDSVPYTVVSNATFDIDLKGAAARGIALDSATNTPLPDVRVYATPSTTGQRIARYATTDSDGRFTLEALPDGTYTLRGEHEHYAAASQSLTISGGAAAPIELRLTRGQEVAVRIVDADTGATRDGDVALMDANTRKYSGSSGSGRAEDGAVHVWAAPGRYTATVHVSGYLTQTADVTVPGPEVRVAVVRAAALTIASRGGGHYRVVPPAGTGRGVSTIGIAAGQHFAMNSLFPGVYEVDKVSDDGKTVLQKYTAVLTGGQTASLDVE